MKLFHGNCLKIMPYIPDKSVDLILTDPPYGTTACKWDSIIPLDLMWVQLKRIIKPDGAIVLFGSEPFSSALRMSNIKNYKYDWIWNKILKTGHLNAKHKLMTQHELIHIFGKGRTKYFPIMEKGEPLHGEGDRKRKKNKIYGSEYNYKDTRKGSTEKYPSSLSISIQKIASSKTIHSTQKPVALMEYFIKTYSNENDTVLDFAMGSGTTGEACKNLNRDFIGIEIEKEYFDIAVKRINPELDFLTT